MALKDNVVAAYSFEEGSGSTVIDRSGNGYTGTITNATYATGKVNSYSVSFTDSTNKIEVSGLLSTFAQTGTYSVSCWVYLNSTGTNRNVWNFNGGGSNRHNLNINGTSIGFQIYNGTTYTAKSGTYPGTGQWNHIVCINNAGSLSLYVNNIEFTSTKNEYAVMSSGNKFVLGYPNSTLNGSGSIDGKIDECIIFNKALSSTEISQLYNSGIGTTYPFDFEVNVGIEGKGIVTKDPDQTTYLYGDEVTLTPTPQLGSKFVKWQGDVTPANDGTITGATYTEGIVGDYALSFNGTSDYVDCGNDSSLSISDEITLSVWIRTTDTLGAIIDKNRHEEYNLHISKGGYIRFEGETTNGKIKFTTTSSFNDGNWHHIVSTYKSNGACKIYVDGINQTLTINSANYGEINSSTNNVLIGKMHDGNFISGELDEVLIYPRELSSSEILRLYNKEKVGGSIGYWGFEEGSGTTAYDTHNEIEEKVITIDDEYTLTSEFSEYPTLRSETIYLDTVPATKAKLTATTTSDNSNFVFGLSNNGGITFEEVTNGAVHTFSDATGNEVQYQIWGKVPGTKISNVVVKIN